MLALEKTVLEFRLTGKDLPVATEPLPQPTTVWVLVEGVHKPRAQWTYRTYTLSADEPGSVREAKLHDRPIPTHKLCHSYTELCGWLYNYGVTPPPPDYFTPTLEEQAEGVESIVRGVMRPR